MQNLSNIMCCGHQRTLSNRRLHRHHRVSQPPSISRSPKRLLLQLRKTPPRASKIQQERKETEERISEMPPRGVSQASLSLQPCACQQNRSPVAVLDGHTSTRNLRTRGGHPPEDAPSAVRCDSGVKNGDSCLNAKAMVKKFLVFQARTHRFWRRRRFFFFSMMYSGKSGTRSRKKKAVLLVDLALFRASPSQARSRTINQFLSCTLFLGHCVDVLAEGVRNCAH